MATIVSTREEPFNDNAAEYIEVGLCSKCGERLLWLEPRGWPEACPKCGAPLEQNVVAASAGTTALIIAEPAVWHVDDFHIVVVAEGSHDPDEDDGAEAPSHGKCSFCGGMVLWLEPAGWPETCPHCHAHLLK